MRFQTQGLVVATIAAVLIRISLTGEYLRFVQPWMRWPLLATGAVLLVVAAAPALGWISSGTRVPITSWLMVAPLVVMFVIAPPPLGAFIAERRASQDPSTLAAPKHLPQARSGQPLDLGVDEFAWGAAQPDDVMGLATHSARMDGFVSTDGHRHWYLTALVIYCCAADVAVERIEVLGAPAPPRDQWVTVVGRWVPGTGRAAGQVAQIRATSVVSIPTPKNPYS